MAFFAADYRTKATLNGIFVQNDDFEGLIGGKVLALLFYILPLITPNETYFLYY